MVLAPVWAPARAAERAQPPDSGPSWTSLFDGKTLSGWATADGTPGNWVVEDGVIKGSGPASHLFSPRGDYTNFRFRAELKINDGGNSGMYFRTAKGPGFPRGYEAQVNSTHRDPVKTGSVYNMVLIRKMLVPPDTWFTQEVEDVGNRITVRVNGEELYEFVDRGGENRGATYTRGHFAFQQHDPGSRVEVRKIEVMELPEPRRGR
jgi:hypothetical protein